ncbi:UDP-N-acetylglucosamine transferase subunit ALG14 like [Arachis hypogaea]|nr:UDP-N-acetylglucosamine transferase subunit ALG14 like [Arachis hypogaea]
MNMDQQYGWVRDTATVEFHSAVQNGTRIANTAQFMKIYSREVSQSYITSVWTTIFAMVHGMPYG